MSDAVLKAAGVPAGNAGVLEKLQAAERASTACASAMIASGGMADEAVRALDCADLASAAARVLGRRGGDPDIARATASAAAQALESSAEACAAHAGHHEHCRLHSESARAAAEALRTGPAGS